MPKISNWSASYVTNHFKIHLVSSLYVLTTILKNFSNLFCIFFFLPEFVIDHVLGYP